MGLFNNYQREGKGVDKDSGDRLPIVVFFDIFFRKAWSLLKVNLLFLLACIPIVTIGPATAGMTKILRNYAREEHAFIWSDFWETFKQNFVKAFLVWLIDIVAGTLILFDLYMYTSLQGSAVFRVISLALILITGTIVLFMNYYVFTLMITFRLTFKQLIKNSFLFAWIGFWRNLLITIIIAVLTVLTVLYFNTFGFVFVILLYFSLCGLIICFNTYPLIKKLMIDGYDPETGEKIEKND